jgi:endonuclease NucS-like protein
MATDIKSWEIIKGQLRPLEATLADHGRTENYDLESWIATDPSILRPGLKIIGRQVMTRSGPLDLLAIDRSGDLYVIELKRDRLPREALAQAIDYASDIQSWPVERISEVCATYTKQSLEEVFNEAFPDTDLESVTINESQRILLVGFSLDSSLERMIEWLSDQYGVGINAVILKYVRTSSGTELLTKTAILSEEMEDERARKKKFTIPTSDEPGQYPVEELKRRLTDYLQQDGVTARRMRDVLFPAILARPVVTREELKQELVRRQLVEDQTKAGFALVGISVQVGILKNDFLRQVLSYEYPQHRWEKDNYKLRPEYRELVADILRTSKD